MRLFFIGERPIDVPLFLRVLDSMMFFFAKERVAVQVQKCEAQNFVVLEVYHPHNSNLTILPFIFRHYAALESKRRRASVQLAKQKTVKRKKRIGNGFVAPRLELKRTPAAVPPKEVSEAAMFNQHPKVNQVVFVDFVSCEQVLLTMQSLLEIGSKWERFSLGVPDVSVRVNVAPMVYTDNSYNMMKIVYVLPFYPTEEYFHSISMKDVIFMQIQQVVQTFNKALSGEAIVMSNIYSVYAKARKCDNIKITICSIQSPYVNFEESRTFLKQVFDMVAVGSGAWASTKKFILNNTKNPWAIKKISSRAF